MRRQALETFTRHLEDARRLKATGQIARTDELRAEVVQRKIYAVLVLPRHFERDLLHQRAPQVTLLYNEQYITRGI